jgi:copper(I)-binding protein
MSFVGVTNPISESNNSNDNTLLITQAYIRATIPGTSISSSYMEIENRSDKAISLLNVTSDILPRIEMHQHTMVNGMMRMGKLESIQIESNARVQLQPSGLHLMILDLETPLKPEQLVEFKLHFSDNVTVSVQVPVYGLAQEQAKQKTTSKMHEHHH